jgi:hypothetical protein
MKNILCAKFLQMLVMRGILMKNDRQVFETKEACENHGKLLFYSGD